VDTHTLSICTGYGGIELGLKPIMPRIRTVCYVENEVGASKILGARIRDGILDDAPIWTDLRTFDAKAWRGKIHLVTGGFPCQPHSIAGKKQGADDPRELSGEVLRIAEELGCPTLFLENVETIKRFYWDNIRPKLHRLGYKTQEGIFSAEEVGAPHRRRRFFILAYHDNSRVSTFGYEGQRKRSERTEERQDRSLFELAGQGQDAQLENTIVNGNRGGSQGLYQEDRTRRSDSTVQTQGSSINLGDTSIERLEGNGFARQTKSCERSRTVPLYPPRPDDTRGWERVYTEMQTLIPTFCRVVNGSTPQVDGQLRAIGNGVVPAVAGKAWSVLTLSTKK
tara:strand:+ start:1103 stop:2116 length:1014 start_codon:yes stop_codon:yes gene_type:complete